MDAASGRPLGWLPAGLTSLILSLERTEVQFKAFSVSHAVKALLSVKRNDSGTHKDHLWGIPFERSAAHRELAKPLEAAGLYSTPSNSCSCDESSEYCTCGCADWSEEAFEDHELPLLLNGPCLQGRRDSRFGGFSWASPLKRRAVEGKYFGGSGRIAEENVEEGSAHDAEEVDGLSSKQTHQDDVKTDAGDAMASSSSCGSSGSGGLPKWNSRMGQNAGAGALAGGVVSLCLHPIDTLKTIVQAQTGGTRHLLPILSSIISERGLKGLYRGLGSNLTSSAPISAIYTLTYEAVKAGLLRHIPEDMSAFAHCAAGGCASVATSFVYTPSECVKQQMQVNGLYQNSWQAFTSILKQGGLPMLYKGWGAVLCRNVPQSVIKFYTYEGLKLWAQGGQPRDTPLTTLQALAIGGVAGSTAAFFTTPLDVVKTRLQTQIPGSVQQYNGVIHAFQSIATTEGVAGLYRGLVPRLVIYVTQGALFFASYEFIKHVLAVEVPRLRIKTSQIEGYQRQPAPIPAEST